MCGESSLGDVVLTLIKREGERTYGDGAGDGPILRVDDAGGGLGDLGKGAGAQVKVHDVAAAPPDDRGSA
jgi:hypothetical protein